MPPKVETRSGIQYGWDLGESGWSVGMDENLLLLGQVGFHLSVKSKSENTPPANPDKGDTYIIASGATGAWAGHDDSVTIWDGEQWAMYSPRVGWSSSVEDVELRTTYWPSGWSAGVAT